MSTSKSRDLSEREKAELRNHGKLAAHDPIPGRAGIHEHEGSKYLREILPADARSDEGMIAGINVDVYCVLAAFNVTCPATQHAIKKLLAAGLRAKGDRLTDLVEAMAALNRAIDMEKQRTQS